MSFARHATSPVFDDVCTQDVFVAPHQGVYQMFAAGRDHVAHRLTSSDGVRWQQGRLDVRTRSGEQKFSGNPVIRSDDSSGILVDDGERLRL